MRRHLRLLGIFYKAAVLTNLEYRANFVTQLLLSVVSVFWSVAGVAVIFQHTDTIGDWTFPELLIVLGLFIFFLGVVEVFLQPNVTDLINHIRLGTMDFILIKPLNSQFHASLRRINIWRIPDLLLGLGVVVAGLVGLESWPAVNQIAWLCVLSVCAIVILYALVMLLVTSAFWFVQLENVMELLFTFYEAGRFPVTIFPPWVRAILTFGVPIVFVTTVPATALTGRLDLRFAIGSAVAATALFALCVWFWQYALRHYSSASS